MKRIKSVFRLIKTRPLKYLVDFLAYQLATIFPLITGILLSNIFAKFESTQYTGIWVLIIVLVSTLLARILFVFFYSVTNAYSRFNSDNTLWSNFFRTLFKKPGAESLQNKRGVVLNCLREDVNQVSDYISEFTTQFLSTFVFSVSALIVLACTNIKIFLLSFSPTIFLFLVVRRISKHLSANRRKYRDSVTASSALVADVINNLKQIKIYCGEESVISQLRRNNNDRLNATVKDNLLRELVLVLHKNAINIGTALLMFFYGLMTASGNFSLKEFSLFIYYMNFISGSTQYLGNIIISAKAAQVSVDNLSEIGKKIDFDDLVTKTTAENYSEPTGYCDDFRCLQVKKLSFSYPDGSEIFRNITLEINKGERVAITGRVGSGKTTLIQIMLGLIACDSGDILVNGRHVETCSLFIKPQFAYSPQAPTFFNASAKDNILMGRDYNNEYMDKVLHYSALKEDVLSDAMQLDETVGGESSKISGGQQQRLSVARMLWSNADVFVIDDLSSSLDNETSQIVWERLLSMNDKTFIIATTRREHLKLMDRVIVLENGSIVYDGKYENWTSAT